MFSKFGSITSDTKNGFVAHWSLYAIIALLFVTWLITASSGHTWGGDFSQYIHHAKNIVEGRPYGDIGYIHTSFAFVGPPLYPPAFSVALAPLYSVVGLDLPVLKSVGIVAFCIAMIFMLALVKKQLSGAYLTAILLLVVLNPYYWGLKDKIVSDYVFLLFCFVILYLLDKRYVRTAQGYQDRNKDNWWFSALLGVLFYFCYATREAGVVLVIALLTFEIFHLRKISKITCGAILIFAGFAFLQHNYLVAPEIDTEMNQRIAELAAAEGRESAYLSHTDFLSIDLERIARQIKRYGAEVRSIWPMSDNVIGNAAGWVAFCMALIFALAGYIRSVIVNTSVMDIFIGGYALLLILFGGFQGLRYVVILIPLFFYYAFDMHRLLLQTRYKNIMLALAVVFVSSTAFTYVASSDAYISDNPDEISSVDAQAFFDYVRSSTSDNSVIVFDRPRVLTLFTERTAAGLPSNSDPVFLIRYMQAIGASYLVLSNIDWHGYSHPVESGALPEDDFTLEYNNDSFYVYRLKT